MAVTPKKFVASRDFSYGGVNYRTGDPVIDRRHIARMVRYGDRFIQSKSKPAKAETPADLTDAAPTTTTVSNKEDS